ncbi:MAG: FliG C-terminal domain-containing protein [Bdellovibrionota bacterium]
MGVYTRFKRNPDGLRQLVELLEVTPGSRRQKMIDVGMAEDPDYTERALKFCIVFEDIEKLPDLELAEVINEAPARMTAYAFKNSTDDVKTRVIKGARPQVAAEVRDLFSSTVDPRSIGGAQLKLIEITRKLEKRGVVKCKRVGDE